MSYLSLNPATEEIINEYAFADSSRINNTLIAVKNAQLNWANYKVSERLVVLERFQKLLISNQHEIARLISLEMGKLFSSSLAEVLSAIRMCDFLLAQAEETLSRDNRLLPEGLIVPVSKEPYGLIFNITPWNYPVWLPLRSALPALIAGNGVIVKPAPNVAGTALRLQSLIEEAGFPLDLFSVLLLSNQDAEILIAHDLITKVVFTGSLATGRHLAGIAGLNIKPITLELGGSDPFIVLADANLEVTAKIAAEARCKNAGQICCSAKRFLIDRKIYSEFSDYFLKEMSALVPGDPFDSVSAFGPLARQDILQKIEAQIINAKNQGAEELLPAKKIGEKGFYLSTGVLTNLNLHQDIYQEEFFGPVAILQAFESLPQAIEISNSSIYGLSASVFTQDFKQAEYLAKYLEVGTLAINKSVSGDAFLPFGGRKKSGYGRESGQEGLLEYVQSKTILA